MSDRMLGYRIMVLLVVLTVMVVGAGATAVRYWGEQGIRPWVVWLLVGTPVTIGLLSWWLLGLPLESGGVTFGISVLMSAAAYWLYRSGGFGR